MWPTYEQISKAFDYSIEISNVVEKNPPVTISSSVIGKQYDNIPLDLVLRNGSEYNEETGIITVASKGYIQSDITFDDKDNFTLEVETKWIQTANNAFMMNIGGFLQGYGLAFEGNSSERLRLHYGPSSSVTTDWHNLKEKGLITLIKEGQTLKFYINNELKATQTDTNNTVLNNAKLNFNLEQTTSAPVPKAINMELYAVRYYDKILTEEEMTIHYDVFAHGYSMDIRECTSLSITADDVIGNKTTTMIHATATVNGIDKVTNEELTDKIITFDVQSEPFEQNTTAETVEKEISYTYLGQTATTTINHTAWVNQSIQVNLNDQWRVAETVTSSEANEYDIYESNSSYNVNNGVATMMLTVFGYDELTLNFYNSSESGDWDPLLAKIDSVPTKNDFDFKLQGSNQAISELTTNICTAHTFTFEDTNEHIIYIKHEKDNTQNGGNDRGYVMVPKA